MMRWVITSTIDPEKLDGVVSGRFGGAVMFVAYSRILRKWFHVFGGGHEKEIAEPQMILVDEDWARANRDLSRPARRENPLRIRKQKAEQLIFAGL